MRLNQRVQGSNPGALTNLLKYLAVCSGLYFRLGPNLASNLGRIDPACSAPLRPCVRFSAEDSVAANLRLIT